MMKKCMFYVVIYSAFYLLYLALCDNLFVFNKSTCYGFVKFTVFSFFGDVVSHFGGVSILSFFWRKIKLLMFNLIWHSFCFMLADLWHDFANFSWKIKGITKTTFSRCQQRFFEIESDFEKFSWKFEKITKLSQDDKLSTTESSFSTTKFVD